MAIREKAPSREAERSDSSRWRMLTLLAAAELLGMSLWFTASAVAPELGAKWRLDPSQIGWLTTAVQLGFVSGTAAAAFLNLADIVPSRMYFAASALLAAGANGCLVVASGYEWALGFRYLTGLCLAGVYPPAMKMIATWFRAHRGLAIGALIGALTVGKATPYLVQAFPNPRPGAVIASTSAGAILAALLVFAFYREGPFPFERRPFSWRLVTTVVHSRRTRLAVAGYLGHMWELYAMWTWIGAFVLASVEARAGQGTGEGSRVATGLISFGAIAAGGAGCLWGGWAASRIGYERVVIRAMAASGLCSLVVGLFFGQSFWLLAPAILLWGFFVVADSAQFSALVTENAPAHAVGTALTLQTSLGFLLTMVTIQTVPLIVDAAGWRWAFPILAIGPALGIWAIRTLREASPRSPRSLDPTPREC